MFADFVASFEDSRAAGKTFVRGNTINPETKGEVSSFFRFDCLMAFKQRNHNLSESILSVQEDFFRYFVI